MCILQLIKEKHLTLM